MRSGWVLLAGLGLLVAGGVMLGILGWRTLHLEARRAADEAREATRRRLVDIARRAPTDLADAEASAVSRWWLVPAAPPARTLLSESQRLDLDQAAFLLRQSGDAAGALQILDAAAAASEGRARAVFLAAGARAATQSGDGAGVLRRSTEGLRAWHQDPEASLPLLDDHGVRLPYLLHHHRVMASTGAARGAAVRDLLTSIFHGYRLHPADPVPPEDLLALLPTQKRPSEWVGARDAVARGRSALARIPEAGEIAWADAGAWLRRQGDRISQLDVARILRERAGETTLALQPVGTPDDPRWITHPLAGRLSAWSIALPRARATGPSRAALWGLVVALGIYGLGVLVGGWAAWRARRAARLQADFVAAVSHEMKTPIASVRAMAEFLASEPDASERTREYSARMAQEMERLGGSVRDVLDAARIERAGRRVVDLEEVPLDQVVSAAVHALRPGVEARGLAFRAQIAPAPQATPVDAEALSGALRNLVDNACKFGASGGWVEVMAEPEETTYVIRVSDAGPGLGGEPLRRLRRRFVRGRAAKDGAVSGVGLGLALAQAAVEAHGGTLSGSERSGGGAVFQVRLPLGGLA